MTLTPDELTATGKQIELYNGNVLTLRYTFGSIAAIEKEYGSVKALEQKLKAAADGEAFTTLGFALWAGTQRKMPLPAFLDLLQPGRMKEYGEAFGAAFAEAFGVQSGEAQAAEENAAA
jgi:hypothetical protein